MKIDLNKFSVIMAKRRKKLVAYKRELVMHEMPKSALVETNTRLTVLDELGLIPAKLKEG